MVFTPNVADCTPPLVTSKSSAAIMIVAGAFRLVRFTKFPPAEKTSPRTISPTPIRSSEFWVREVVLPEERVFELPVFETCLSSVFADMNP